MSTNTQFTDLNDIIFMYKNREYGAYVIRSLYSKFLTYATIIATISFLLAISAPVIINYLTPKKDATAKVKKTVITNLDAPPSIDDKKNIEKVELPPPSLKSTVAFLPPVVKPDDQVIDDYIPTQEEMKTVDPGTKTQQGDPSGVDYSLIEVQEKKEEVVEEKEAKPEVFTYVEEMPSYPGGQDVLMQYFKENIQYPEIAIRAGVEGKVFVSFVVAKSGAISEIQVLKGIGAGCDEEAIRVIKSMPRWNPGKQNGRPVNVKVSVPIFFSLK